MKVADCSFAYFVYPFVFDSHFASEHIQAFDAAQYEGTSVWTEQPFPADDLMPHVARFVNPPNACASDSAIPTARFWKLNDAMENVYGLGGRAEWTLRVRTEMDIAFRLGEVGKGCVAAHLALFCSGVGFLTLQARPKSEELDAWLDFLHYFRIEDGQRGVTVGAQRRTGKDQSDPFFPEPAGGLLQQPDGSGKVQGLRKALLQTGSVAAEGGDWWTEAFVPGRSLPYVCLYVEDMRDDMECARLLYRLRNFFRSGQEIFPGAAELRLDHPALIEYAERQWFAFGLEGGAFAACAPPNTPFFRANLPQHLRGEYFLIFLLALQQRFTLIRLSDEVASKWHVDDKAQDAQDARETEFGLIRDSLLQFTARGYFAQVMQRDHHHRCYVKWLEVFQTERLYNEVRDEVQDMHDYLLLQQNRRREEQAKQSARATTGLTNVAGLLGPPGLVLTLFQALAINNPHFVLPAALAALAAGGGVVSAFNYRGWAGRRRTNPFRVSSAAPSAHAIAPRARKALPP